MKEKYYSRLGIGLLVIVLVLIIFQDGIEVKRYIADISFTIPATREEVQLFINEIY